MYPARPRSSFSYVPKTRYYRTSTDSSTGVQSRSCTTLNKTERYGVKGIDILAHTDLPLWWMKYPNEPTNLPSYLYYMNKFYDNPYLIHELFILDNKNKNIIRLKSFSPFEKDVTSSTTLNPILYIHKK